MTIPSCAPQGLGRAGLVAALAVAVILPGMGRAATAPPDSAAAGQNRVTFRSYPHPESRAYTLVRAGYIYPIINGDKGDHPTIDPGGKLAFDLGVMVNAGAKWGIGAAFRLQTAENDESMGPMIRLRRWLGRDTALDVGVGRLSPTNAEEPTQLSSEPQLVGILELQYKNAVSVNAQVETWRVEDAGYSHASGSGTIGYLGFGLHYVPGLVAVAIGLIAAGGSFYSY